MNHNAAETAGREGCTGVNLSVDDDTASHAGSVGEAEKIRIAHACAGMEFTQSSGVYIIFHCHGDMEFIFYNAPYRHAGITGNIAVGIKNRAIVSVHFSGGADTDGIKTGISVEELHYPLHQMGTALGCLGVPFFHVGQFCSVPKTCFDGSTANIHCDNFHKKLLLYFWIAETNLAVISAGLVIAPPTTSAKAPASKAFFACSG